MSGGGGGGNSTSKTIAELPGYAQPYAEQLLQRGADLSNQGMPVYTGQRSANMNWYQQAGTDMTANRAMNGSPVMNSGNANLQSTLNGSFLNGNPYLDSQINKASQDVTRNYQSATNNTDSMMARAGAFGGSAWQQAQEGNQRQLAQGLGDVASGMRYQNYANERQNQMQALGMVPTYANQAYVDAQQLQNVGQQRYAYDQQKIDDSMDQWSDYAQSPYKQLDILGNTLRGSVGGGGTTTQVGPRANGLAQGVGAAAALYSILGNSN